MNANTPLDFLSRLAGAWADWALAASWQLALLVALVALAAFASRRLSARFRYLLWMLVLIKALTPPSFGTAWSIGNWAGPDLWHKTRGQVMSAFAAPQPSTAVTAQSPPPAAVALAARPIGPGEEPIVAVESKVPDAPILARAATLSASALALAVWLSGFTLLALFIVLRTWRLSRALTRVSEVDEGPLRVTLERLALRLGRSDPPALLLTDTVSSPFLFGLCRPCIVLPASLPENLSPEQLEDVLLHELTHWRRRDLPAAWLQIFVQALFWFHPLVWLAGAQMRHERECACDEEALQSGCSQARRYGESLLRVLLAARGRSAAALGFLGIFERNTRLQRRLEEIMSQENKTRRFGIWAWLSLILFAGACLPMGAAKVGQAVVSNGGRSALQFDGQHDYLEVVDHPSLALEQSTIIEGWIKVHEASGETALLSKEIPWKSGYALIVSGGTNAKAFDLIFAIGYGQRFVNLSAPDVIPRDQWTHVMAIYGREENELWVNFQEVASQRRQQSASAAAVPLRIGKGSGALGRYFDGEIASLRFWRYDYPHQRDVNYDRIQLDGSEPGLVAGWDFFNTNGALVDKSPNKLQARRGKNRDLKQVPLSDLAFKEKSEARLYGTGPQWQRPFQDDPAVRGHWTAVDFVSEIHQFVPGRKQWQENLYLQELDFLPNGKMAQVWSWTCGWLWHPGDHSEGQYEIRSMDGRPYLFMEWVSGDVTLRGMKPHYYVFAKDETTRNTNGKMGAMGQGGERSAPASAQAPAPATSTSPDDESTLARQRDEALARGDLIGALDKEMARVTLRAQMGHPYKDKIDLASLWPDFISRNKPSREAIAESEKRVREYLQAHREDPDFPWRLHDLMAAMSESLGQRETAAKEMDLALETYPTINYIEPSKHSKYQHLLNQRAGMVWDAQGVEAAEKFVLGRLAGDPKSDYFFAPWWREQYEKKGQMDRYARLLSQVRQRYQQRAEKFPEKRPLVERYLSEPEMQNANAIKPVAGEQNPNDTWIVSFKGKPPYQPRTPRELLDASGKLAPGTRTHDFRVETKDGELIGHILVDGQAGKQSVVDMLNANAKLMLVVAEPGTPEALKAHAHIGYAPDTTAAAPLAVPGEPPKILSTSPAVGAKDVDPATAEITVTFDRDMQGGMSWTGGPPQFPPIPDGARGVWRDKRTCALPVKLEAGHFYRVGINSTSFQNFKSADGVPARPSAIYFTTRGAGAAQAAMTQKPEIVSMEPANGAAGVDSGLKELRVTFNMPMGGGFSWCGGGPNFPEIPQGQRPSWSEDHRTCILPVKLKSGWEYQLGLNSPSAKNFQSEGGVPLEPVVYSWTTKQ